jgi:dTDP-4-amino-4,6-dideoxygalactose transaminase
MTAPPGAAAAAPPAPPKGARRASRRARPASGGQAAPAVPFLDLGPSHAPVRDAVLADVADLIDRSAFVNGPAVEAFERDFARWCGAPRCVGTASGLDALRLALIAAGLEAGDEVLVPANTFIATFEAVRQAGGVPVPVDVTERDLNLDVAAAEAAVGPRTRFVMPVHLYGQMADMVAVRRLAARHGLGVVEDACQAHGASRDGLRPGAAALAAAFSFYPGKNLGAMGDAGALVTAEDALADTVRALREHGQRVKHVHEREGWTSRLDAVQAVVLRRKLPLLHGWNAERRALAAAYAAELDGVGDLVHPPVPAGSEPVWHLYVVRTARPEALATALAAHGVATGRHYPEPPHLSAAFAWLGHRRGDFPVAEALAQQILSLPVFPGMTPAQVAAVCAGVRAACARRARRVA